MSNSNDTDPAQRLRQADWDLPWPPTLLDQVQRETRRRQSRSRIGAVAAAAVTIVVISGGVALTQSQRGSTSATQRPTATLSTSQSPGSRRIPGANGTVQIGGWTFDVPAGFVADPAISTGDARFGPDALVNDGGALGPQDMRVEVTTRALADTGSRRRIWITRIVPSPTAAHPGPRPAVNPTDRAAAATTIVEVTARQGMAVDRLPTNRTRSIPGVAIGTATLVTFTPENGIVLIIPSGSGEVLLLQAANCPVRTLIALAASGRR